MTLLAQPGPANAQRSVADFVARLFEQLGSRHIRYCILHSYENLPAELASDLDLAVDQRELWRLGSVFSALEQRGYHPVQCLRHAVGAQCFVFAWMDDSMVRTVAVDIVTESREGGLIHMTGEELLRDRRPYRGFWIPSAAAEYRYLLSKKVLKGTLAPQQAKKLAALAREIGPAGARRISGRLFGDRWGDEAARRSQDETLAEILDALRRRLWLQMLTRRPWVPVWCKITDIPRLISRFLHRTGMLVAILGPDGSGKSTLIDQMKTRLAFVFRAGAVFHWRPQFIFPGKPGPVSTPHARPPHGLTRSLAHLAAYVIDYNLGFALRIRPLLCRTGLTLFDRYLHDLEGDPRRYRYGGPPAVAALLPRLVPSPDLLLILDAPAETVLSRKLETSAEQIDAARERYRRLAQRGIGRLIDASRPADAVARQAYQAVLQALEARFSRRHGDMLAPVGPALEGVVAALGGSATDTCAAGEQRFAVVPGPGDPRWLVPLDATSTKADRLAVYSPYSLKARTLKTGLSLAMRLPSSVWARGTVTLPARSWIDQLAREVLGETGAQFTVSLGTPGRFRKATVQVNAAGGIRAFVKLPLTADARQRVEREAAMLARLSARPSLRPFLPEVIYAGEWNGRFVLAEAPLGGQAGKVRFGRQHRAFLDTLSGVASHPRSVPELLSDIVLRWEPVAHHMAANERGSVMEALRLVERSHSGQMIACGFTHGDFAPWNTRHRTERLGVFDWESGSDSQPHDWDSFHFHVQTGSLLGRDAGCKPDLSHRETRCSYILYLIHSLGCSLAEQGAGASAAADRVTRLREQIGGRHGD